MARENRRIVLAARPAGEPVDGDFKLEAATVDDPGPDQMLLRVLWLSLDPYMRGRMNDTRSYAPPVRLGQVMVGGTLSQVIESRNPEFGIGDIVLSNHGWQEYALATAGDRLVVVDPALAPISTALGVLGMPGQTAYFGLLRVGKPQPGETVVVSSAAGAVGSAVGQIAKIEGCRAVGIAGGPAKCAYVTDELGFDACLDYKAPGLPEALAAACPDGIDVYFENVGGIVLDAVVPLLKRGSRVPICGFISAYNELDLDPAKTPFGVLGALSDPPEHRFLLVGEWVDEYEECVATMAAWMREGKLRYRESIVEGLENAPRAFRGLLRGENFGKQLVRVAEPL